MTAPGAIIAGWDTFDDSVGGDIYAATTTIGLTASIAGTAEAGGTWFNFNNSGVDYGGSTDGTFGATGAGASTVSDLRGAIVLSNGYDGYLDITLTETAGIARPLDTFHFDSSLMRFRAADLWEVSVLAGSSITVGSLQSGGPLPNSTASGASEDFDIDLAGLADNTLDANGTVTFRLNFTGGQAPETTASGHHTFVDNIAVSGAVPEPASIALGALGLGLLGFRRRR